MGKTVRVDHVSNYKPPKDNENYDDITRKLHSEGCAPVNQIPERNIKQEDSRSRKRSPALRISPDVKRIKRESPESHRERSGKRVSSHLYIYHINHQISISIDSLIIYCVNGILLFTTMRNSQSYDA